MTAQPDVAAVLIVSFGGPERPADVRPFLENVTRGRGVPPERLDEVEAHYRQLGGRSPINDQVRALIAALREELDRTGRGHWPIYWGNRNWSPYLTEALAEMAADGVGECFAFVTSAYSSYSGCRQYREDIESARREVGASAPVVHKLRVYFDHPGFIEPMASRLRAAIDGLSRPEQARLLCCAHSIPVSAAAGCAYEAQLRATAQLVADAAGLGAAWELVWQSRSGPPQVPWLEPDVGERLAQLAADGVDQVVLAPIGFVSDHLEVVYDLDTVAAPLGRSLGMEVVRADTVGTDARFVAMIVELVEERRAALAGGDPPRRALSSLGVWPDRCAADCCPAPAAQRPPSAGPGAGAGSPADRDPPADRSPRPDRPNSAEKGS